MFAIKHASVALIAASLSLGVASAPALAAAPSKAASSSAMTSRSAVSATAMRSATGSPIRTVVPVTVAVALDSGTWAQGGDDEGCQTDVDNANSWQQYGDELADAGDKAGATKAYDNASSIAGQANHDGCTIFLMD